MARPARAFAASLTVGFTGFIGWSLFSGSGPFYWVDSVNHYFLLRAYAQDGSILHYTVSSRVTGAFYPLYALYGGSLYATVATFGRLVGSVWFAYSISFLVAFAAALLGVALLSRELGTSWTKSLLVGLIYVSSAYYLTNIFGRGAWTEVMATSAFPLALASFIRVARSRSPSRWWLAVLIVSTAWWSGSHLISLLYGSIFALAYVGILRVFDEQSWPSRGSILATIGVAIGVLLNAWFLLPQLHYASSTAVSSVTSGIAYTGPAHIFILLNPIPVVPAGSTTPGLYISIPTLSLLWAVAVLTFTSWGRSLKRVARPTMLLLACYLVLMGWHGVWSVLPGFMRVIQYSDRLLTYATLVVCILAALAFKALPNNTAASRRWLAVGAAIVCCQLSFGIFQVMHSRSSKSTINAQVAALNRDGEPPNYYGAADYRFIARHPAYAPDWVPLQMVPAGHHSEILPNPELPGSRVVLNVADTPFMHVTEGAIRVGPASNGLLVVEIDPGQRSPSVVVRPAVPRIARIGIWTSFAAVLAAIILVVSGGDPRRRRLRSSSSKPTPDRRPALSATNSPSRSI